MKDETSSKKVIDTPMLSVKDNLFTWNDKIVQIPNISMISASPIDRGAVPIWALIVIALGLLGFKSSVLIAICFIAAGSVGLYFWYAENKKRMQGAIMTVQLNSGASLYIQFKDKKFLLEVIDVLRYAIASGRGAQLTVNMKSCTISGNAQLLNNLSMK